MIDPSDISPEIWQMAERAGLADDLARELAGATGADVVRRDCAFCGRERSRADDNHAPECSYWTFFGGGPE